jgi:hypothetical protein
VWLRRRQSSATERNEKENTEGAGERQDPERHAENRRRIIPHPKA